MSPECPPAPGVCPKCPTNPRDPVLAISPGVKCFPQRPGGVPRVSPARCPLPSPALRWQHQPSTPQTHREHRPPLQRGQRGERLVGSGVPPPQQGGVWGVGVAWRSPWDRWCHQFGVASAKLSPELCSHCRRPPKPSWMCQNGECLGLGGPQRLPLFVLGGAEPSVPPLCQTPTTWPSCCVTNTTWPHLSWTSRRSTVRGQWH